MNRNDNNDNNLTALVSCFARSYHYRESDVRVFSDEAAERLLRKEEFSAIAENMRAGIAFFAPDFQGSPEEALRLITDRFLAPPVLARSAFCEQALAEAAEKDGFSQYVLFGAGYDSFSIRCRMPNLTVYELDLPERIKDKLARISPLRGPEHSPAFFLPCDLTQTDWIRALTDSGFHSDKPAFGSLLGLCHYLTEAAFERLLQTIARAFAPASRIAFDYPLLVQKEALSKNRALAKGAGEPMRSAYSPEAMTALLSRCGFTVLQHADSHLLTETFFSAYNRANPEHLMQAPADSACCLAVRNE